MIIQKKAEETLLVALKDYALRNPNLRCLHVKLSLTGQNDQTITDFVIDTLRITFGTEISSIFVCRDTDIFVLGRGLTFKQADEFSAKMIDKIAPKHKPVPQEGLASLYEVGVDLGRLVNLCQRKIEIIQLGEKKEKTKKVEINKSDVQAAMKSINQELVQSLHSRRQSRETIEVLVVEDDLFSQKLVSNSLKKNYSLTIASDGQSALFKYVNKAPDILFLDIGLPDIDGHDVLQKIFEIDPKAFVVMFSGNGDKDNILKAIETGAKGFVGKPFSKEKLIQYIEKSPFVEAKKQSPKGEQDNGNING